VAAAARTSPVAAAWEAQRFSEAEVEAAEVEARRFSAEEAAEAEAEQEVRTSSMAEEEEARRFSAALVAAQAEALARMFSAMAAMAAMVRWRYSMARLVVEEAGQILMVGVAMTAVVSAVVGGFFPAFPGAGKMPSLPFRSGQDRR